MRFRSKRLCSICVEAQGHNTIYGESVINVNNLIKRVQAIVDLSQKRCKDDKLDATPNILLKESLRIACCRRSLRGKFHIACIVISNVLCFVLTS
jgi:hypothetical protein